MFYTSGTTGFPKGVKSSLLEPGMPASIGGLVAGEVCEGLHLPADGVTALCGPLYHSAQWAWSVLPLVMGSRVVMQHRFDPAELLSLFDEHRVTNVHLGPTQFIRLLKLPPEVKDAFDGSSMQVVWHGAAPCSQQVKRDMIEWFGPIIHEYYGGTEGGIISTISSTEWARAAGQRRHPGDNYEIRILDEDGAEQPTGQPGQIWFRQKDGRDFEYHNAPEKTAAAHREGGFGTLGDIGYLDEDGYLYLSDRKIDMIISGGVNIYPAEVEGVLVTHPAVKDAAVFGIPHDEMGEDVKAAVELVDGEQPSDELAVELIRHVREHLAGYKAPRSIDFEDEFPRHPTGSCASASCGTGTGRAPAARSDDDQAVRRRVGSLRPMRCPVCLDAELVPHIRGGIEIDHCPRCRGMWLDRGELEKMLDLAEARSPEPRIATPEPPRAPEPLASDRRARERYDDPYDRDDRDRYDDRRGPRRKKRKGAFADFLEDIFEGFD